MSHTAWMQQAESDLVAAKILSGANHHSQAVWLAAQAVEKAHKAILAALGLRYTEKHFKKFGHQSSADLSNLLPAALHDPADPLVAVMLEKLETRAEASRYPAPGSATGGAPAQLVAPTLSFFGSQQEIADAEGLIAWCRERIERAGRAEQAMRP
jgi:HEPN domain-containing protein